MPLRKHVVSEEPWQMPADRSMHDHMTRRFFFFLKPENRVLALTKKCEPTSKAEVVCPSRLIQAHLIDFFAQFAEGLQETNQRDSRQMCCPYQCFKEVFWHIVSSNTCSRGVFGRWAKFATCGRHLSVLSALKPVPCGV
jgi:hypothetical protein